MLNNSQNEIQNRLDTEINKSSNIQQKIREVMTYGDIIPSDFNDIDQLDDEINLNEFLNLAENNKTKYDSTPLFDVLFDSDRYKNPKYGMVKF